MKTTSQPSYGRIGLILVSLVVTFLAVFSAGAVILPKVTNVSPLPQLTNEFYLTATNMNFNINGTNVHVDVYKDDPPGGGGVPAALPGPLIEANVGQMIVCHFRNSLTNNIEGASIHWHGIELDNDSDGTAVSQDSVLTGQTYTYRFIAPRAGLYWYHSHMIPGTTIFAGMYGPILIHDTNETALVNSGVLPSTNYTFQLMLSDISFTNSTVGKIYNGTNYSLNTLIQLCENSILGAPNGDHNACGSAGPAGDVVLCNGKVPTLKGTFGAPLNTSTPIFFIGANKRIRLQLFDASISRSLYLTLHYPASNPTGNTNLYHIGGQGGLLDNAVLDGGVQSGHNFHFAAGTVNINTGMREDVMFYSSGNNGDIIQLVGNPETDGNWRLSLNFPTNYPIAFFVVTNGGSADATLAAGSPILAATSTLNENLNLLATNILALPANGSPGSPGYEIFLNNGTPVNGVATGPSIDNYAAPALDGNSGFGSWQFVPHPPSSVWARAGDVLQLAIANDTGTNSGSGAAVHPYHLHGFSMQPVSIYSANLQTNLYNFPFHEFLDTYDVFPGEALVFRIKLSDRPIFADTATGGPVTVGVDSPTGGNVGRWLMHCHIFLHGTIGMISELDVIPNTSTRLLGPMAGTDSVVLPGTASGVVWTVTTNASWLHVAPSFTTGNGLDTILYTYDANPGPTRMASINAGGEIVTVTQAGASYVKAPGPLTTLATGLSGPVGMAADPNGNVYFCDGGHGALKRWNKSNNTVTTLATGFGNLQGLAMDSYGNVYFADFGSTAVRMWSAASHTISTLFNNTTTGISGLAVDSAANIYFTVPGQNNVLEWTAATGVITAFTTNGLNAAYGVAVDVAGAVYAADTGDNAVKKLGFTVIFIGGHPFFISSWNTVISNTDLSTPWNLAVDSGGNVYVADGSDNAIKRFNFASNTVETVVASGLSTPTGVAVGDPGNVYISDFNNGAIKELPYAYVDPTPQNEPADLTVDTLPSVLLPTENLSTPFAPTPNQSWVFYGGSTTGVVQFLVSANLGAPRSGTLTVLGQPIVINQAGASSGTGTTNLLVGPAAGSNTVTEFQFPSIASWSAGTTTPWLHLPVTTGTGSGNVLFNYDANAGLTRSGTLTINGVPVTVTQAGSTYVQAPGPVTTLVGTGLGNPVSPAVDASGNVIFSDSGIGAILEWSPGNTTATSLFNGFTPQGVSVDPAGNIYFADFNNQAVKEWRASDHSIIPLVDNSPGSPEGMSLDSATNVYWANPGDSSVKEWIAATTNVVTIVATNLTAPYGLAVDVANNIYIADTSGNAIKKWNPIANSLTTLGTSGINHPGNVAVDGSGNVYVANGFANNIVEWVAASGNIVTLVPGGLNDPTGVSVDRSQNLYIADFNNSALKELPHAFVDPTPRTEPATAGSDSLPVVLPPGQNLSAQFAPVSSQPWLSIVGANSGVVNFNFLANTDIVARAASITLLGQNITVSQNAAVYPPVLANPGMPAAGIYQFTFTNGTPGAVYSVLFTTNLLTPRINWTLIGVATNISPNLWQFADTHASNNTRFYTIRSP